MGPLWRDMLMIVASASSVRIYAHDTSEWPLWEKLVLYTIGAACVYTFCRTIPKPERRKDE